MLSARLRCYTDAMSSQKQNAQANNTLTKILLATFWIPPFILWLVIIFNGNLKIALIFSGLTLLPGIVIFPIIAVLFVRRRAHHRLRQTIIAEYEAPDHLLPAEIGLLYDVKFGTGEVYAGILSLMERHYLQFATDHTKMLVSTSKPNKHKLSASDNYLLQQVTNKTLTRDLLEKLKKPYQNAVYNDMARKGYLYSNLKLGFRKRTYRIVLWGICITAIFCFAFAVLGNSSQTDGSFSQIIRLWLFLLVLISPFLYLTAHIVTRLYTRAIGLSWVGTAKLRKIWPDIEGFRVYIQCTIAQELHYTSDEVAQMLSEQAGPYAPALGFSSIKL